MEYIVLDELMKIKKKGDSSKEKRQTYEDEMYKLLKAEGATNKAQQYLKEGFSFNGAASVIRYFDSINDEEEKNKTFARFIDSRLFRENDRGIGFKMALHMLAMELKKENPDKEVVDKLIKTIPVKVVGKEGEHLKDAGKTIEKYFLKELIHLEQLPDLYSMNVERGYVTTFSNLIAAHLGASKAFHKLTTEEQDRFVQWLGDKEEGSEDCVSKKSIQQIEGPAESSSQPKETASSKDNAVSIDAIINQLRGFNDYCNELKGRVRELEKTVEKSREIIDSLHRNVEARSNQIEMLNKKAEEQNAIINRLESQDFQLKKQLEEKNIENEELHKEIKRMDTVNSVYAADKESSKSEQLNAIASKLKADFLDFKDAENMDMDIELGENFRCQIQSIFRILKKEGIDVEGRQ